MCNILQLKRYLGYLGYCVKICRSSEHHDRILKCQHLGGSAIYSAVRHLNNIVTDRSLLKQHRHRETVTQIISPQTGDYSGNIVSDRRLVKQGHHR